MADYRTFDGSFSKDAVEQDGIRELKLIQPWRAFWQPHHDAEEDGYHHRPEFYPEGTFKLTPNHSQAIATAWATHRGGIMQGPFECPADHLITFSVAVQQITPEQDGGEGMARAFIHPQLEPDPLLHTTLFVSSATYKWYYTWETLTVTWVADGRPFWVGVIDDWRCRAKTCITLIDDATLEVAAPDKEKPDGEWYTIDTRGYRIEIRMTPK